MEALLSRIAQLERENKALEEQRNTLRAQRDKFREIATEAEAETARRRKENVDLEIKFENERRKRVSLEMKAAGDNTAHAETFSSATALEPPIRAPISTSKPVSKRTIVVEDDSDDHNEKPNPVIKRQKMFVEIAKVEKKPNVNPKPSSFKGREDIATSSKLESSPRARRVIREASRVPLTLAERQSLQNQSQNQRRTLKKEAVSPKKEALLSPKKEASSSPKKKRESPTKYIPKTSPARHSSPLSDAPSSPRASASPEQDNKSEGKGKGKGTSETFNSDPSPRKPAKGKARSKEEGGWTLSPSQVSKYLSDATVFHFETDSILANNISRQVLTQKYGLPGMGFLWTSKDKKHRFMLPTYETNPDMPRAPGVPGLLLSCRDEMCKDVPWTLFLKTEGGNSKKVKWTYAGEYICTAVGSLSSEEFISQNEAVKQVWGEKIAKHKKYPVYRFLRARMTLRKKFSSQNIDREPTEEEIDDEAASIRSSGYVSSLTQQDVVEAFERGDEKIVVIKVECVAYDNDKAKEFNQIQEQYDEREQQKAPKETGGKRKRESQSKSAGGTKKVKLNPPPDTNDEGGGEEGGLGDEPVDSLTQQDSTLPGSTTRPKRGGGRVESESYQVTSPPDNSESASDSEHDSESA